MQQTGINLQQYNSFFKLLYFLLTGDSDSRPRKQAIIFTINTSERMAYLQFIGLHVQFHSAETKENQ